MTMVPPPSCDRCFQHAGDLHSRKPSFTLPCGHLLCISCVYPEDESCFICYQPIRIDFVNYLRDTVARLRLRKHIHRPSSNRLHNPVHPSADTYSSYDLVARLNVVISQINNETSITTLLRIKRDADAFLRWQPRNQYKELEAKTNLIGCLINQHDIVSSQESTITSLLRTINAQIAHNQRTDSEECIDKHDPECPKQEYPTRLTNERLDEQIHSKKAFQQRDRRATVEVDHSPQTTNDANVDSVSSTRNGQHIVSPPQHNVRSVTALSFPKYEDGDDYESWGIRNQKTSTRHSSPERLVNAPQPRQTSLPLSDIDDPTTFPSSRMQDTTYAGHASERNHDRRADKQIQATGSGGYFDPATRPALQISIPKRSTFYALSIADRYTTRPSSYQNGDRHADGRLSPSKPNETRDSSDYSRRAGAEGDRGNIFVPLSDDEWDDVNRDDGTGHFHAAQGKIKKRVKLKGKARAPSPGLFNPADSSSADPGPSNGRNAYTESRPNLSRYSSFSSIGLLKTPDPKSGTIPVQLLEGPVYDSSLHFPLHPIPKHPPQSYDPVLTTFDSDYPSDTHSEPQKVRLYDPKIVAQPSRSDEEYYIYQSIGSLENSPAREVHIDVKDNRRTSGVRPDRTLSSLHIPSPYSSPRPTGQSSHSRSERRLRSSSSKLNITLLNHHDGYMSSEECSNGWVSSATAVQASPRRRNPHADIESPSSVHSHHVHFSGSTRHISPNEEQTSSPVPTEPCTPPLGYNNTTQSSPLPSNQVAENGTSVATSPLSSPSALSNGPGSRRLEPEMRTRKSAINGEQSPRPAFAVSGSDGRHGEPSSVDSRAKLQQHRHDQSESSSRPPVFTR